MGKNLIKKLILTFTAASVLYVTGCNLDRLEKIPQTYALIYCGTSDLPESDLIHPIDENKNWISTVSVFNLLEGMGVNEEDIFVLYSDGIPKNEPKISSHKIASKFEGYESNEASLVNLIDVETKIRGRLNPEDRLIIYIMAEAYSGYVQKAIKTVDFSSLNRADNEVNLERRINDKPQEEISPLQLEARSYSSIYLFSEFDNMLISPSYISNLLNNNVNTDNLVILESSYAGIFLDKIQASGTFIGASKDNTVWYDANFSFGRIYFGMLVDPNNDLNGDGQVSYEEAYNAAIIAYQQIGESKMDFIWDVYVQEIIKKTDDFISEYYRINYIANLDFTPVFEHKL